MNSLWVLRTSRRSVAKVRLQAVAAAFPAETRLAVAAEGAGGVEAVEGVGPHDAGPQALRHPQDAAALVGPDARRQAVGGVVGLLDRLGRGAEGEEREHRAEDLLPGDAVRGGDAGEDGGGEPVAPLRQ